MKFAFSSLACPTWDFQTLAVKARELGYDGVELRAFSREVFNTLSNPYLSDPGKVRGIFDNENIRIACLSTSVRFCDKPREDAKAARELEMAIDIAGRLNCPFVKLFDFNLGPGESRHPRIIEMAGWIGELAEKAAKNDVTLLIENQLACRSAKDMWALHEACDHRAVKICWDMLGGAAVGEKPTTAVPLLSGKVGMVQAKDAWLGDNGAVYCMLGEGDVGIEEYFNLLRGVGYRGWVSFEWEKAFLPNLADAEKVLPAALEAMRELIHPQLVEETMGAPSAE